MLGPISEIRQLQNSIPCQKKIKWKQPFHNYEREGLISIF